MLKKISIVALLIVSLAGGCFANPITGYFTDKGKPVFKSDLDPSKYYRGKISIPFSVVDKDTSVRKVTVLLDGYDVTKKVKFSKDYSKNQLDLDSTDLKDGKHTLTIVATDFAQAKNTQTLVIDFFTGNNPPILRMDSIDGAFKQGKTGIIYFTCSNPSCEISGNFQGKDLKAYPYKGGLYRAVLGFSIDDPGSTSYKLNLKAKDVTGNTSEYHFNVYVGTGKFETIRIVLKPKKAMLLMPDTIRDDWKSIEDVVVEENPTLFLKGNFIMPAKGRVSMLFGTKEYINGDPSGRHRGVDIANVLGTPVKASNNGVVRLAQRLPAHGNCVVIEHGEGIFTYYAHLNQILVKVGQKVVKGELIGKMGMTGVASGPHLHFSMSVHNLRVDPLQWIDGVVTD
jgi:murein DD-endopeptidase MepM/ murein hydrolase activator NlpD